MPTSTLDGTINADLTDSGTATDLPLNGTTATADVDMAGGKAHATFAIPAFLNLNGELIQIGETSYVKTSLTGPQFTTEQATDSLPVDPTDAAGIFDDVGDFLLADGVDPVKGDDVDCGGKRCYTVSIELTPEELAALGAGPGRGAWSAAGRGFGQPRVHDPGREGHLPPGRDDGGRIARGAGHADAEPGPVEVGSADGHLAAPGRPDQARLTLGRLAEHARPRPGQVPHLQ